MTDENRVNPEGFRQRDFRAERKAADGFDAFGHLRPNRPAR